MTGESTFGNHEFSAFLPAFFPILRYNLISMLTTLSGIPII